MSLIEDPRECNGQHRFYVAESGTVTDQEGLTICTVVVCTSCGESRLIRHKVADGGTYTVTTQNKEN